MTRNSIQCLSLSPPGHWFNCGSSEFQLKAIITARALGVRHPERMPGSHPHPWNYCRPRTYSILPQNLNELWLRAYSKVTGAAEKFAVPLINPLQKNDHTGIVRSQTLSKRKGFSIERGSSENISTGPGRLLFSSLFLVSQVTRAKWTFDTGVTLQHYKTNREK